MGELVAAFAVPHAPAYPKQVSREGPDGELAQLYRAVAEHLEAVRPDVLVVIANDHLSTFFLDNLPLLCIGQAESAHGPNDGTVMPHYEVPLHSELAAHLRASGIANGFDLAVSHEFSLDHGFTVPLHFLTPRMDIPIVPVWISDLVPPFPTARRCYALGQTIGRATTSWPSDARVAILASGSISLDLGGPLGQGRAYATKPDPAWATRVGTLLRAGDSRQLVDEATSSRLARAGNIGGELLNWIAMLGAIGERKATLIEPRPEPFDGGNIFGAWRWDR
jgi:protocatechuate 4,5-dioxygenase beta chain